MPTYAHHIRGYMRSRTRDLLTHIKTATGRDVPAGSQYVMGPRRVKEWHQYASSQMLRPAAVGTPELARPRASSRGSRVAAMRGGVVSSDRLRTQVMNRYTVASSCDPGRTR